MYVNYCFQRWEVQFVWWLKRNALTYLIMFSSAAHRWKTLWLAIAVGLSSAKVALLDFCRRQRLRSTGGRSVPSNPACTFYLYGNFLLLFSFYSSVNYVIDTRQQRLGRQQLQATLRYVHLAAFGRSECVCRWGSRPRLLLCTKIE